MNACPEGWHLPQISEWDNLIESYGGTTRKINSTIYVYGVFGNTSTYEALIDGGGSGFSALLGGNFHRSMGGFNFIDSFCTVLGKGNLNQKISPL